MAEVKFGYLDKAGGWHPVTTLEEQEYRVLPPTLQTTAATMSRIWSRRKGPSSFESESSPVAAKPEPSSRGTREFQENQRGVSFDLLFGSVPSSARPRSLSRTPTSVGFIRARNLMELIEGIATSKDPGR